MTMIKLQMEEELLLRSLAELSLQSSQSLKRKKATSLMTYQRVI
jgi:hypothetical protein